MRCTIVSCIYPPEPAVSGQTSAQVATALAERGHEVTVVAPFPSRPAGKRYHGFGRALLRRERGTREPTIWRCFSVPSPKSTMASRFLENISFGLASGTLLMTIRKPDVIYSNTWPIFATGMVALIARLRRIPLVISVQDTYPESLISQQRFGGRSALARLLRWLDARIARSSSTLIAISPAFAELYVKSRGVPAERLVVVPNWGDERTVQPNDAAAEAIRARHAIPPDAFLAVYGGNIGVAAGVEILVEAVARCEGSAGPYCLIAGEGSNLASCQETAETCRCERVVFHSPWPSEETSAVLAAADVLVLPTRGEQSLVSVPSKLISYLLAARPVIALALPHSELAAVIRGAGCGWVLAPDDSVALSRKLEEVMALPPAERDRLGQAGRAYALAHLTREACLPKVIEVVERACDRRAQ